MKNILTESTHSKFQVLEHKPANVLKRIKGVLSDFNSNRNGRIYSRELWQNVLNSDYVKEMINSHGLVGELDHPEERLEISLQNVSHVINDMWIEGDSVVGVIDILPTPSGKIVNELLDYGTDIGISSRGAGSVGNGNIVDSDYQFITFDFVARPSCEAARLNTILESVKTEIQTNSDDKVTAILEGYKEDIQDMLGAHPDTVLLQKYNLNGDDEFKYMMLSRLQSDCKYVLGAADGNMNHLWVKDDPHTHCEIMRELYNTLPEKPDWISLEDIDNYEKEMLNYKSDGSKDIPNPTVIKDKNELNEAIMSDQDVFKTVLTWYKDNIESGKMTLNQCYELLSDKAKVSLNKMVDQTKIKESMINNTIDKLIKESISLNESGNDGRDKTNKE